MKFGTPGVALLHARHDVIQPAGSLTAWRALAAGLVLVEVRQPRNGVDDVGALVHHDDRGSAQAALRLLEAVEVHQHVAGNGLCDQGD